MWHTITGTSYYYMCSSHGSETESHLAGEKGKLIENSRNKLENGEKTDRNFCCFTIQLIFFNSVVFQKNSGGIFISAVHICTIVQDQAPKSLRRSGHLTGEVRARQHQSTGRSHTTALPLVLPSCDSQILTRIQCRQT